LRRLPTFAPFGEQLIARDEGLHTQFACELYSMLERKLSDAEVHAIVEEAVAIETEFVTSALPSGLIGINADLMTEYVRYCADRLLVALDAPKRYNAAMPFDWMEMVSNPGPKPWPPTLPPTLPSNLTLSDQFARENVRISTQTCPTTSTYSRFTPYAPQELFRKTRVGIRQGERDAERAELGLGHVQGLYLRGRVLRSRKGTCVCRVAWRVWRDVAGLSKTLHL
jgi:hypothetical protein